MKTIENMIEALKRIADYPKQAIEDYKKETGKGAVGIMPVYSPEEIVHAAGFLPVGMWGGHRQISKARAYLAPFACSIMQTVMEMQLEGVYDGLDAVIFSVPCDTLKCMSQKWHGKAPAIVFTHPQNRKIEAANVFLMKEFEGVKARLEKILNVEISEEALNRSIDIYNENRRMMREFSDVAAEYPHIITPSVRHAVIKARFFMEKSKHTAAVRELTDAVKQQPKVPWKGKKVILTGIMAEPYEVLHILEENQFAVAADDLAQESRQFRVDVPEGDNPLYRLAKAWQNLDGCSLATDPEKPRGKMLIHMVDKYKADAVITCMMKFCEPEEFDYPVYSKEFDDAGVRSLMIEIDQETASFEQMKTRIQTFAEIL